MARKNKVYGYTVALWEIGKTVHGLFQFTSRYKKEKRIPTTNLWKSIVEPSWAPFFVRPFLGSMFPESRDDGGDAWNLCHLWSNFEIADMDFFRSEQYRAYFDALDHEGGFYYQRVGLKFQIRMQESLIACYSGVTQQSIHSLRHFS